MTVGVQVQLPELLPARGLGGKPARPYLSSVHQAAQSAPVQSNHNCAGGFILLCAHYFSVLCFASGNEATITAAVQPVQLKESLAASGTQCGSHLRMKAKSAPTGNCGSHKRLQPLMVLQLTQSSCTSSHSNPGCSSLLSVHNWSSLVLIGPKLGQL